MIDFVEPIRLLLICQLLNINKNRINGYCSGNYTTTAAVGQKDGCLLIRGYKMELQRLFSGKPDLRIKVAPSARQSIRKSGDRDAGSQ